MEDPHLATLVQAVQRGTRGDLQTFNGVGHIPSHAGQLPPAYACMHTASLVQGGQHERRKVQELDEMWAKAVLPRALASQADT